MIQKLTVEQVKEILPLSSVSIKKLVKQGKLPEPEKIGRRNYFDADALHAALGINKGDSLIGNQQITELTGMSTGWTWLNVTKKFKGLKLVDKPLYSRKLIEEKFSNYIEVNKRC